MTSTPRNAPQLADVKALFTALGREFNPSAAAPYLVLSAEQFAAIDKDLRVHGGLLVRAVSRTLKDPGVTK